MPRLRPAHLRRPRRTAVVGSAGLLVGVLGGWVAGLLRVHPVPRPGDRP